MKIQIDTDSKTIKLEKSAKIDKLITFLEKILPLEYLEYTLETNTVISNWYGVTYYPYDYWKWDAPYVQPWTYTLQNPNSLTVSGGTAPSSNNVVNMSVKKGIMNIELQDN